MINVSIEYREEAVVPETGLLVDDLPFTKKINCSAVITQPTLLVLKDTHGKSCSFFYEKIDKLVIDETEVEEISLEGINSVIAVKN